MPPCLSSARASGFAREPARKLRMPVPRGVATAAIAAYVGVCSPLTSLSPLAVNAAPPCIPGVTAQRCRGVFWETGKLYKKPSLDATALTQQEYSATLRRLDSLRVRLRLLTKLADDGKVGEVGKLAAQIRAEIREVGERLCSCLSGDDRLDGSRRLLALVRVLDDIDAEALSEPPDATPIAAGFAPLSTMLDRANFRFDEFRAGLPTESAYEAY